MSYSNGPRIVTNGLVLYLDAGSTKSYPGSGTTWTDLSGNNNNGTLINGPTYSSANKGSIVFDGVNDYVQTLQNNISNNFSFSLSCWFRITTLNNTYRPLIDGGNLGIGNAGYTLSIDNSNRLFIAANGGFISISTTLSINTWYNVVGTAAFGTPYSFLIFLNGTPGSGVASATTNSLTNNVSYVRIGQNTNGNIARFPGQIAQVSIYNRSLTALEILQNYNATKGRYNL